MDLQKTVSQGTPGITVGTTPNLTLVGATGNITLSFTVPTGTNPNIAGNLVTTALSSDTVTLGANAIVAGVLTHAGGSIALGTNNLTIKGSGCAIDGAATITGSTEASCLTRREIESLDYNFSSNNCSKRYAES